MNTPSAILLDRLTSLDLDQSQPEIYDRPIQLRLLYQDPGQHPLFVIRFHGPFDVIPVKT